MEHSLENPELWVFPRGHEESTWTEHVSCLAGLTRYNAYPCNKAAISSPPTISEGGSEGSAGSSMVEDYRVSVEELRLARPCIHTHGYIYTVQTSGTRRVSQGSLIDANGDEAWNPSVGTANE